jgi:hypothetical protein
MTSRLKKHAIKAFMVWCPKCGVCLTGVMESLTRAHEYELPSKVVECTICDTEFEIIAPE